MKRKKIVRNVRRSSGEEWEANKRKSAGRRRKSSAEVKLGNT